MRLAPKPTTRDIIDLTAPPSARVNAESPNARCEKMCEKTTILRYVRAAANASADTFAPPHQPSTVSTLKKTSGGRMKKKSSFSAISSPTSFSHATRSFSPSLIERTEACPAPTKTPNAPKSIITGKVSVSPAIAASPHPCPM